MTHWIDHTTPLSLDSMYAMTCTRPALSEYSIVERLNLDSRPESPVSNFSQDVIIEDEPMNQEQDEWLQQIS